MATNLSPEEIDRLFREETERLNDTLPRTSFSTDRFWQQLQPRLEPPRATRRLVWLRVAAGVLFVTLGGLISWQFYTQQKKLENYASELKRLKMQRETAVILKKNAQNAAQSQNLSEPTEKLHKTQNLGAEPSDIRPTENVVQNTMQNTPQPLAQQQSPMPVVTDSSTETTVAVAAPVSVKKPLRVVHANELRNDAPVQSPSDTFIVKAKPEERRNSPKLTVSFITKSHQ